MSEQSERARRELAKFKRRADSRLEALSKEWEKASLDGGEKAKSPPPRAMVTAVTDLTLRGGKRVRPALAYFAAQCFDHGLDEVALLDATLSIELLQTYLLIHDDVMDNDSERRGGPSVHVMLSEATGGDEELGRSLAILAGDLGCAMSQELLLRSFSMPGSGITTERLRAAFAELIRMQWDVIQGQHLDLIGGAEPAVIHDAKTASYTTRGPVLFGAGLAGATSVARDCLERFGTPLGRAFQVRDDLLGIFGKKSSLGKPVGADIRAGKRTELVEAALRAAEPGQQEILLAALGRVDATPEQIAAACHVIEQTGARAQSEELIDRLTQEALAALAGGDFREEGVSFLRDIAFLLAERDR